MRRRAKSSRRPKGERFTMLPDRLLTSSRWKSLPPAARAIFIDVCTRHHHASDDWPTNNGQIGYGCRAAASAASSSSTSRAATMIGDVIAAGLLRIRKDAIFKVKGGERRAREFEIAIYPMTGRPHPDWGQRWLHLDHSMLGSHAYRALPSTAKCVLIEMMRRYNGSNNGTIAFGGKTGAYIGFSDDVTERALTAIECAGFAVQTRPASPRRGQERRWRLTMYRADGARPTNDFLRSGDCASDAGEKARNAPTMRVKDHPQNAAARPPEDEGVITSKHLGDERIDIINRTDRAIAAGITRADRTHLEASHSAPSATPVAAWEPAQAGLFADGILQSGPTPQDRLRSELRVALAQKRGTQSRLAKALGVSPSALAHVLAGRHQFTATAAAALRRWLDGDPINDKWPPLLWCARV